MNHYGQGEREEFGFSQETQEAFLAIAITILNIHHFLIHRITTDVTLWLQQLDQNVGTDLDKDSSYSTFHASKQGGTHLLLCPMSPAQTYLRRNASSFMEVTKPRSSRKQFKDRLPNI